MNTSIIVLSRYPDIFADCQASLDLFAPTTNKCLIRDGHDIIDPSGWQTIQAPDGPFIYSRNGNLGINQTKDSVLLVNDDCRFVKSDTIERLEHVMEIHPEIGILSPKIDGGVGNADQSGVSTSVLYTQMRLAFVCVLIRRAVIDEIGLLDERFNGYGQEDTDYCRRAVIAGWKLACTADAVVKHGHGNQKWSSSFQRVNNGHEQAHATEVAGQRYFEKWGDSKYKNFSNLSPTPDAPRQVTYGRPRYIDKGGLVQDWWARHNR